MKKLLPLLLLVLSIQLSDAQNKDPRSDQFNFVPGKIIVKLKDNVDAKVTYSSKGVGATQTDIGKLLGLENKVSKSAVLFSEKSVQKSVARKAANKQDPRVPNPHTLKNTFLLELSNKEENILSLVEELNKNPKVEYAEPDYNYSVNDFTIDSDIIFPNNTNKKENNNAILATPNDPLYAQQTNITLTNIDKVWETYTTGNGSQIIAILDTGVDYTHPDLADNIWINQAELNGVAGFDDDANGYIDDIRGWDFINLDNAPLDDNMHGTHVAGIAGAVGGNGIGIVGAAWNVKLMPIKVFQSNGVGNASTIAAGIEYATNNGATIQNMSFGSYAESITMRNALENAYASSVLVAAAGNDAIKIGPCVGCFPHYPGAYTYVIGVQDAAGYSNFDQDGPIFSRYSNFLNYELKAPGSGIMSTVPNGGYRILTGTSMSSPLVAGGIALYLQQKPDDSTELLFGNLINTSATYVDLLAAIEVTQIPELKVLSAMTLDTINRQNGNGFLEPNEVIELFPVIKNYWGSSTDVRVGIEFAEFEDQSKATILEGEIAIGSISAYATLQDFTKSLKIKIAANVANNVNIKFNLKVWSGPNQDYLTSTEYVINVKNSILLYGIYNEDMTLTPDKEYLVSDQLIFTENAILTIEPGSVLKISDGKQISFLENSQLICEGIANKKIIITNENNGWSGFSFNSDIYSSIKYTEISGIQSNYYGGQLGGKATFDNVLFKNLYRFYFGYYDMILTNSNIFDSHIAQMFDHYQLLNVQNINISRISYGIILKVYSIVDMSSFESNINIINKKHDINQYNISSSTSGGGIQRDIDVYLGTADDSRINSKIKDVYTSDDTTLLIDRSYISHTPYEGAHGIVWKVLVNGKDAQDEYELMDPIGVGKHMFDVYFNRAMDTSVNPQISYGIREPYNQKIISEAGIWSPDGKIYSVTHDVKIGAADGINRIRVQGARDLDYFDIPIEDSRFNMLVQSAGSASAGFMATSGLGEITLDWEAPDVSELEDVLGYNMYRYEALTETTFTPTSKINASLINDPVFVDFNVEEGKKYYYQYKILRTSFEETDFSKTVAAKPLTSQLGDSNGDFAVNVLDLVQDVDYILGNNPAPFIFKAADVNNDTSINVLDIVGTVDLILNPTSGKVAVKGSKSIVYIENTPVGEATFFWEGNDLYVESKEEIGGLQLAFEKDFKYTVSADLPKFEWLNYNQADKQILMLYSFSGIAIKAGKTKLFTKTDAKEVVFDLEKAVVGTPKGKKLTAKFADKTMADIEAPEQTDQAELFVMGPNPTSGLLNIYYYLPEQMDKVTISAYNLQGARVWSSDAFKNTSGSATATVNLSALNSGLYIVVIDVLRNGELKKREVKQIILNK